MLRLLSTAPFQGNIYIYILNAALSEVSNNGLCRESVAGHAEVVNIRLAKKSVGLMM